MSLKTTLGVFVSGVVVYGAVAGFTGAGRARPVAGVARSALAVWIDPVGVARADSGTRLKAEYLLGDDGSKDYQMWLVPWSYGQNGVGLDARPASLYWDTMRNEECVFQTAADGALRCIPTSTALVIDAWGYLDAACTQRGVNIAPPPPGCTLEPPLYTVVYDFPGQTCSTGPSFYPGHFFPIGAFVGPNQPCYFLNQGVCQPDGSCPILNHTSAPGYATYAVGAEVPPSSFVASTPAHDP